MRTILFVCTGNSCRSVMAAAMFKKMLGPENEKRIFVFSGGIGAIAGMSATDNTIKLLQKEGIDAAQHRSSPVLKTMLEQADLILVMEEFHKARILEIAPTAQGKVFLLREFGRDPKEVTDSEIQDPIGKPLEVYERVFDLIKEGLENLMKRLKAEGWM